jgi:hypothetical protein
MAESKETEAQDASSRPTVATEADLSLLQGFVARLAQFLARPESLQQAIRDRYTVAGALPEDWQTLLELMPKTGPVLRVNGEQGKWLVGIHSAAPSVTQAGARPESQPAAAQAAPTEPRVPIEEKTRLEQLQPVEENTEVVPQAADDPDDRIELTLPVPGPKPDSVAAPAEERGGPEEIGAQAIIGGDAASGDETPAPSWAQVSLESIQTIKAIDREIRVTTEERLNLDRMASELRILEISPPFEAFELSAKSVSDALRRTPPETPDPIATQIIKLYQDNLQRGWGVMLKTCLLAALLASSEGRKISPRNLTAALRFLSSELEFASLSTEQIDSLLDNLAIGTGFQPGRESQLAIAFHSFSGASIDLPMLGRTWVDAQQVAKRLMSLDKSMVSACYRNRAHNLILHMRSGNRLPPMDLVELRLLYSDKVTRFSGDPNTISLGDYARALRGADAAGAEGFIMTAFLKLGFVSYVQKTLNESDVRAQIDPELWQDIVEQAGSFNEPSQKALIVSGELLKWVPSTEWAVVQLDPELVFRLETPRVTVCMTGRDVDAETTIRIRKLMLPGVKVVPLEDEAGDVDIAIRRALYVQSEDKNLPPGQSASL